MLTSSSPICPFQICFSTLLNQTSQPRPAFIYPAPPGSFPHQAAHPPPTYAGDLLAAPSQPTAATSRLGLLPSLLARVRSRMTSIAERRSQVADFFTSIRDMVIAYFMGPEGTARMFSVTSLIIGSILAL